MIILFWIIIWLLIGFIFGCMFGATAELPIESVPFLILGGGITALVFMTIGMWIICKGMYQFLFVNVVDKIKREGFLSLFRPEGKR